jgi:stage IV sporulation protein FA
MNRKNRIRQRRQERIRELRNRYAGTVAGASRFRPYEEIRLPDAVRRPDAEINDSRMHDPEYVWKRERQLRRLQTGADGGGPGSGASHGRQLLKSFIVKLGLSALLFAAVWGIFHFEPPGTEKVREHILRSLREDMNFASVQAWYASVFSGAPSFIPSFGSWMEESRKVDGTPHPFYLPVQGRVVKPFSGEHRGVDILAAATEVKAMDTGLVVYAGQTGGGWTVKIQHANHMLTEYGNIAELQVKENEWIKGGEVIGLLAGSDDTTPHLYFAVMKNGQYVNPAEVIPID